MTAVGSLRRTLIDLAAIGGSVPCGEYGSHELWTSDRAEQRAVAVTRCHACPVISACSAAANEAGEQWHVWGGVDRTKSAPTKAGKGGSALSPRPPPKTARTTTRQSQSKSITKQPTERQTSESERHGTRQPS